MASAAWPSALDSSRRALQAQCDTFAVRFNALAATTPLPPPTICTTNSCNGGGFLPAIDPAAAMRVPTSGAAGTAGGLAVAVATAAVMVMSMLA